MSPIQLEQKTQLEEFERQGFLSLENALTPALVSAFNREIDDYLKRFPEEWIHFDASLVQTVNVLPRTSVFDAAIENAPTLALLRAMLGEEITFEEFSDHDSLPDNSDNGHQELAPRHYARLRAAQGDPGDLTHLLPHGSGRDRPLFQHHS